MTKYIPTFGIEIHAELSTKTKAFSNAKVDFDSAPNTNVTPVDLGYPGAKPTVNKKMVEYSYRLAKVLDMTIADTLFFDRKSYFYPDLPKGFQITQFFKPIGVDGKFKIDVNGEFKDISITEIHMEEDTAKQIKTEDGILFDFNRSGVPLIEIVSGHKELSSIEDVIAYVKQMRDQLVIMGINDGKLEEGSFRVDVNVSIRPEGTSEYGVRTEVKNLNSFKNIRKALEIEIERHKGIYESGETLESTTVRFDEDKEITIPMRLKDSGFDYNFIPEGNITPIELTDKIKAFFEESALKDVQVSNFINEWRDEMNDDELSVILGSKQMFDTFNNLIKVVDKKESINFLVNNVKSAINESNSKIIRLDINEIKELISLRKEGKVDNNKTKDLISKMLTESIEKELDEYTNKVLLSEEKIKEMINIIISNNQEKVDVDKETRPENVERFIMGQLMKETKGQASPQLANKLVKEVLWEK